jgi:hypothetical protein
MNPTAFVEPHAPTHSLTLSLSLSLSLLSDTHRHAPTQVIRAASGDNRLMNPTAFVESHPACALNESGQAVIANGMPWKAHLYLMIVSAKLLADTENMLQVGTRSLVIDVTVRWTHLMAYRTSGRSPLNAS